MNNEEEFSSWLKKFNPKTAKDFELPERREPEPRQAPKYVEVRERPVQRPVRQVPQRPVERVQRPVMQQQPIIRPRPQIPQPAPKPVMPKPLNEAYQMIDEMKKKMESIFYRYGMIGLERLDEALEDVIEEIMNPSPIYIEKEPEYEPPKPVIRKKPKKRRVVKKVEEKAVSEPVIEEQEQPEEVFDDYVEEIPQEPISVNEQQASLDLNDLSAILSKESKMPKHYTQAEMNAMSRMASTQAVLDENRANEPEEEPEETEEVQEDIDYSNVSNGLVSDEELNTPPLEIEEDNGEEE